MTSPLDEKPFPSHRFDGAKEVPSRTTDSSAPPAPDGMDVVAWECTDLIMGGEPGVITDVDHAAMRKLQPKAWAVEDLVRISQAQSALAAMRGERDEALLCQQEIAAGTDKSATVARIIIAKNEAENRAEVAEYKLVQQVNGIQPMIISRAEAAEAQVKRLTKNNEALRAALRGLLVNPDKTSRAAARAILTQGECRWPVS